MLGDHSRLLVDLQTDVLERVAYGESAEAVADLLCRRVESFTPEAVCSVLSVGRDRRLRTIASPSLPESSTRPVNGLEIGPAVGSCGTAAWRGEPVIVTDIASDPLWEGFRHLALDVGLRACWSSPIKARDGRVVGTFAFYYRTPRGPSESEREIVARCTHLCAIAIEHDEMQRQLREMAYADALTGLPNRAAFNRRIAALTQPGAPRFALLLVDIDHLKEINDTLGHAGGDALLKVAASRLKNSALQMEAFRLGGDEFAVTLPDCADEQEMAGAARFLIEALALPLEYENQTLTPYVTMGGVLWDGKTDAETLAQNADFALYHGKEENRGGFVSYREGFRCTITHRIQMIRNVSEALAEGRVIPFYQPIVRLDTAEIVGLEALARIQGRDGRIIPAAEFHEATTDPRIGDSLTTMMLAQVAADMRSWLDRGIPLQHVGFNVAGADFQKNDLEDRIHDAFGSVDVPLRHLILEVNETVFMGGRDNRVARAVESLRKTGMRVALDDFGTGYASLTHLLEFPVDVIKIDKSFVDRLVEDRQSLAIVEALIEVTRKLDMRIVAEGVETAEQSETLLALGCLLGQGYRYSAPVPAAITYDLLRGFAQRPGIRELHTLPYGRSA